MIECATVVPGIRMIAHDINLASTQQTSIEPKSGEAMLPNETLDWCTEIGSKSKTLLNVLGGKDKTFINAIQSHVNVVKSRLESSTHAIEKFAILDKDFSLAKGEIGT